MYETSQNHRVRRTWQRLIPRLLLVGILLTGTTATLAQSQTTDEPQYVTQVRTLSQESIQQLSIAIRLTFFALSSPGLDDMKLRSAQVLNVLVGENSPLFDSEVGLPTNISDATGIIPRLEQIRVILTPHRDSDTRVPNWLNALENIQFFSGAGRDEMHSIGSMNNDRVARIALRKTIAFLAATRGNTQDPVSEGGARALEQDVARDSQ